jgi:pimeloyl-ACP methyl ester carboxylesterase
LYLANLAIIIVNQDSLIFAPKKERFDIEKYKEDGYREFSLEMEETIHGKAWYLPPHDNKPIIVYFHGNTGNISYVVPYMRDYVTEGYGVLLLEYRGYAGNDGKPSEQGFYNDARAWIEWLETAQGVSPDRVFLYGVSMGCAVAVQMALDFPDVPVLILQSPFTSRVDISLLRFPMYPFQLFQRTKFDNLAKIQNVKADLLILHGDQDMIVPVSMGKALFEKANAPKKMVVLPNVAHNMHPFGVSKIILEFLKTVQAGLKE